MSSQPNIVLVVLDDANAQQLLTRLPLARQALRAQGCNILCFQNAYATTPVCAASRASMLTGNFPRENGVEFNSSSPKTGVLGGAEAFLESGAYLDTIATRLSAMGYATALCGKYINDFDKDTSPQGPPGWDFFRAFKAPGDGYFKYALMHENGVIEPHGTEQADYSTDVLKLRCVQVVNNSSAAPFFLWFAPSAPHDPAIPATRHATLYSGQALPEPPSYDNPESQIGKPDWLQGLAWTDKQAADEAVCWRNQLRCMAALDEAIVTIINAVVAKGKIADTIFLFTMDNSFSHGEHCWRGKGFAYQPAVRCPIVVAGAPTLVGGEGDRLQLVGNLDLPVTIAALGGGSTEGVSGVSFAPLLMADGPDPRAELFLTRKSLNPSGGGTPANPMPTWRGFVARRAAKLWKFIETPIESFVELYDLDADPYELVNVASAPENAALVAELGAALA